MKEIKKTRKKNHVQFDEGTWLENKKKNLYLQVATYNYRYIERESVYLWKYIMKKRKEKKRFSEIKT